MKKVALLGDSIRLIQTDDNCRWAQYTLRMLFNYKDNLKDCDVIHWNNGLWDCTELFGDGTFTSEENYIETMTRIAKHLLKITPNVIFATTTPTKPTYLYTHNDKIDRFNKIIVPRLKEMGIVINDLNSLLRGKEDEMICDDELHLSEKGAEICAKAVYNAIKSFEK